jgi:glycerol 3-phosphatase-2
VTASLASTYELVILDLDGVVYLGTEVVPGAPEAILAVVDGGTSVVYATNNASRGADEVASLLALLGMPASAEQVLTSARVAAGVLAADLPAAAPVLVVGAPALRAEVAAAGLIPVALAADRPLAVVQGYGPRVCWTDLAEACVAIRAGTRWVATNVDATLPSPRGALPGNGSLVAALTTALGGRTPDTVVGKPHPAMFEVAAAGRRSLVVGDRLDTDIEGAVAAGMDSLLVLTGVATAADVLGATTHQRPTHLAFDLSGLSCPDATSRVPPYQKDNADSHTDGWRVREDGDRLALVGDGRPIEALLALASAAWAKPGWTGIVPVGAAAWEALDALALSPSSGETVRAASAASADHRS